MRIPIKLVLLGVGILGVAYFVNMRSNARDLHSFVDSNATSMNSIESRLDNCTMMALLGVASCFLRAAEFIREICCLDFSKESSLDSFHNSCNSLEECIHFNPCENGEQQKDLARKLKYACTSFHFMHKDFAPCQNKFDKNNANSTCFESWNPFVGFERNSTELSQEEMCGNFFGKNNCMKKEVTETCSEKEWLKMRDTYIEITPELKDCGFENL